MFFMKIAILSDFHIGYERFREDARKQAEEALLSAADNADMLLIPGDIFDRRSPSPDVLVEGLTLFRSVSRKKFDAKITRYLGEGKIYTDVPIIAIPGTHERVAQGVDNAVSLLNLAGLVADVSSATVIVEKNGEKVAVTGIGGLAEERFKEYVKNTKFEPVPGAFNILMMHQSLFELLPYSQDFLHFDELPKGFDLYIDGHIHSRVEKKVHGKPFLIPGSTVLTQLKETEQEPKGYFIFDTDTKIYTYHNIKSRKFYYLKINASGKDPELLRREIKELIDGKLQASEDRPIIRVELAGTLKEGFRSIDANLDSVEKSYKDNALVEITSAGIDESVRESASSLKQNYLDNASAKERGLAILLEKLQKNKYALDVNPSLLFEILSSGESKEKVLKKALDEIYK